MLCSLLEDNPPTLDWNFPSLPHHLTALSDDTRWEQFHIISHSVALELLVFRTGFSLVWGGGSMSFMMSLYTLFHIPHSMRRLRDRQQGFFTYSLYFLLSSFFAFFLAHSLYCFIFSLIFSFPAVFLAFSEFHCLALLLLSLALFSFLLLCSC